jgi:hypothetical protein
VVQIFDGINASGVDVAEVSPQSRSSVVAVEEPAMKVRDYLLGSCTSTAGRNQSLTQRHNLFASSNYTLASAGFGYAFRASHGPRAELVQRSVADEVQSCSARLVNPRLDRSSQTCSS